MECRRAAALPHRGDEQAFVAQLRLNDEPNRLRAAAGSAITPPSSTRG